LFVRALTVAGDQSTTVVDEQPTTVVAATTLLDSKNKPPQDTSSSDSPVLVKRLANLGIPIDDDAARKIISRCQNTDGGATVEEITYFAKLKVQQLAKRKNIENWPGTLMAAVPVYFDLPATELSRYRAEKRREKEREEQFAREILANPKSTDEEQDWARSIVSPISAAADGAPKE
jgi:hypothetical protein